MMVLVLTIVFKIFLTFMLFGFFCIIEGQLDWRGFFNKVAFGLTFAALLWAVWK